MTTKPIIMPMIEADKKSASGPSSAIQSALLVCLIALLMTGCSSGPRTPPAPTSAALLPAIQTGETNHAPVVLRVVDREEIKDGYLYLHKDIYFTDPDGDATTVANKLVSVDPEGGIFLSISDDTLTVSADEQKREGVFPWTVGCPKPLDPFSFTVEARIRDQAGNMSEPMTFTFACPAAPQNNMPFLITGLGIGLVLLVGGWLLFRNRPLERRPAFQSTLLLFCILFPLRFMLLILHEGGHALSYLERVGKDLTLYVHPFAISGYSRPIISLNTVWDNVSGVTVAILVSLLIFIILWKRRSISNLPLVMLFPWIMINSGIYILSSEGDFSNVMEITGLPAVPFIVLGGLIACIGAFFFISLFPLLGLAPQDKKTLFVIPASLFLWGSLTKLVGHLIVPGSPFAVRYHLEGEILSVNMFIYMTIVGLLLAIIYIALYRRGYQRLPAGLRTETVSLTWRDLRLPALLAAISVILGLIIIL